ncbi:TRAP transporter, 4TM/12TM fusion protein [Paucidesulfovibrio gracilis DSM 16080]|uniref:TRAP transporter, 4TM/12TM fusion protein n=1 Tax=Paucidesulfovibrio gracilis DSM 16080 TaxID=1121449 RepID=A0A1T4W5L0_9BACT|nr:TRAP transporter permease [Paucidesulfovibrio gracilis]SKA72487.1 TRAP transporter, 4TM/12TM fusion protein [Paucidesulfovibrio gracilis DSM 16080]
MSDTVKNEQELSAEKKAQLKKIMEKDSKAARKLSGPWGLFISLLGVAMVVFYYFNAGVQSTATNYYRGVYVLITYIMVFLCYPMMARSKRERPTVVDILLALVATACVGYWIIEFPDLNYRMGAETELDLAVSLVGLLISLEVCRRVLGWSMTIAGVLFLIYGYFGPYFPGALGHRGLSIHDIGITLFISLDGVFGIMANVLVTYVILFIFFGAFLQKSGVGKFFIDWPLALAGRTTGGPAKVAVMASAFFGSVSGSAIANTVSTGAFTIPLMKRAGFRPHVAGAIEPSASIGGMFMPPIMGAGGFLMAELTNTPYVQIMKMAIFPAALYFLSVLTMIHFEAKKHNIRGLMDEEFPGAWSIFKKHWYKSLPLVIIVVMMLKGYSPGASAFWATMSCIVISWLDKEYRMGPKQIWEAMILGARNTLVIGATVGVIGIIVGTIAKTGIGLKFSDIIIAMATSVPDMLQLPIAILLIGIASLVLGMGVPVTASYLIVAVLAVPALNELFLLAGVYPVAEPGQIAYGLIAAHMIVYWFSQDSNITPPVCVAAYAGAAVAGADPWKTGWTAFKFAKLLYVVPFLFAYEPAILLHGTTSEILLAFGSAIIGTIAFSSLTMGYMIRRTTWYEWILFAAGTFMCYHPNRLTDLAGIGVCFGVYLLQKSKNIRDARLATA